MGTIDTSSRYTEQLTRGSSYLDGRSRLTLWLQRFERMMEKRRTRRALLALTDEQLKDIGLSRSQVHAEAMRPFWD